MAFSTRWIGYTEAPAGVAVVLNGEDNVAYSVDWGDGVVEAPAMLGDRNGNGVADTGYANHSYAEDGVYTAFVSRVDGAEPRQQVRVHSFVEGVEDRAISGNGLRDIVLGGAGDDDIVTRGGEDFVLAGAGADKVAGGDGNDMLYGGAGNDLLRGDAGVDYMEGGAGADRMYGGADNDVLIGGAGNDLLMGDGGVDVLVGGAGADRMYGGADMDVFSFQPLVSNDSRTDDTGRDLILDFVKGEDRIDVSAWHRSPISFIGAGAFSGARPEVRAVTNSGGTLIFGDVDGDKLVDFSIKLDDVVQLSASDFLL